MVEHPDTTAHEPTPAPAAASSPPRMSRGEKIFDTFVYGPMNMIGTFLLTIPLAWSLEHGAGRKPFEAVKNFLTTRMKMDPGLASKALTTTTLMMGGNLMIAPVRWAESRKADIVAWLNGGRRDENRSPSAEEVSGPKQSWGSLIKGRMVAWLMVFGGFVGFEKIAGGEKLGQIETTFADKVCAKFGWAKEEMAMVDGQMKTRPTRAYGYSRLAALDVFATVAAGILLYAGSRFFAKQTEEKSTAKPMAQAPVTPPTSDQAGPEPISPRHASIPRTELSADRSMDGVVSVPAMASERVPA